MARPKIPTKIKELKGTLQPCRQTSNEMQVAEVVELPQAPNYFDDFAQKEWDVTTSELARIKMLHIVDLSILSAYCFEIGTYHRIMNEMGGKFTERTYDKDGKLRASKIAPLYKVAQTALQNAIKIATQFGFTPSSRASLSMPEQEKEKTDDFNFFD
jgi:P27 family predicted phage terminase small subunit